MNKTKIKTMLMFVLAILGGSVWADGESINIKFNSGTFDANTDYGCYPVKGSMWRVVGGGTTVDDSEIDNGVTVSYKTSATWSMSSSGFSAHMLLDSYLDDGVVNEGGTTITISGLDTTTFADYDLLIYVTADTTPNVGKHFRALTVNGTQYTYGKAGEDNWGTVHSYTKPIIGVNCLKVEGLHATAENNTLTIATPGIESGARGNGRACISAIQIVKANSIPTSVLDTATSQWTFENSIKDLRGSVASWTGDDNTENAFVDSLRKSESGVAYKAAKMSDALRPYANGYAWADQVTIAVYANIEKCPDNGVLVSSGGKTKLRKLNNTTIKFGGDSYFCSAELEKLSEGYHLIIASRDVTNGKLSLQIDGGEPVVFNNASDISNGIQIGAEWGDGTHSFTADGGAIIDDVLIWNKILNTDEISELVALYPAIVPVKLTGVGPHRISDLIENGLSSSDIISLENGAILNIDAIPTFKVPVISTGGITVKVTNPEITLEEAQEIIDLTGVEETTALEIGYRYGYAAEDGKEYARIFYGTFDMFWNTPTNWYVGTIDNGVEVTLIPQPEDTPPAPATVGSEKWDPVLIDGNLIGDNISDGEDGFKTVICTNVLEGWNLRLGVFNGVHVKIDEIKKLQSESANNNAGWVTVDETSKMTIGTLGSQGNNTFGGEFNIFGSLVVTEDFTAKGNNPGYNYSLGTHGKVEYQGLSLTEAGTRTHNIKSVILDLGDPELTGKTIISRQLIAFTNQVSQTFTYDSNGVTSTVDQAEVAFRASLANVGEYNFEVKADGYYVNYVAYNETDDVNVVSTWTPVDVNSQWTDETLWSNGRCPDSGDIVIDTSRLDADILLNIAQPFNSVIIMGNADYSTNVDFSNAPSRIEIYGKVSVEGVNPENLIFGTGSEVVINNVNPNDVTVPSGATVILNGADEESNIKSFGKFIVSQGGSLKTRGYIALTLESEINGEFDVCDGKAVVTSSDRKIKGPIYVRRGATLAPQTTDAFNYGGTQEMHIYGTLAMGSTRWTTGGSNTIYLYGGSAVTGGDNTQGNIDFNADGAGHIVVKRNMETDDTIVDFSAALRSTNNDNGTIAIDPGVTLIMSGKLINSRKITKNGAGHLVFDTPEGSEGGHIWVNEGTVGGKGFVYKITMAPGTVLQPELEGLSVNGFWMPEDSEGSIVLNSGRIDPERLSGSNYTLLTVKGQDSSLEADRINVSLGSRYESTISDKTISVTVKDGLPTNFLHYDFNNGATKELAAASDSGTIINYGGEADGGVSNGKSVKVCSGYTPHWGSYAANTSPLASQEITVTTVAKMKETGVVLWGLGNTNNNNPAFGLVALSANKVAIVTRNTAQEVEQMLTVDNTEDLTKGYHFFAIVANATGTTLHVDNLKSTTSKILPMNIGQKGQFGSFHGGAIGANKVSGDGFRLDDWAIYDSVLTENELKALRSRLTPRPFFIRVR